MKKIYFIAIAVILLFSSCSEEKRVTRSSFLLDTFCSVTIFGTNNPQIAQETLEIVSDYQAILDPFDSESQIYKLNTQRSAEFDQEIIDLIELSLEVGQKSNGKFDITMGKLRDLWQVKDDTPQIPEASEIARTLATTGNRQVVIDGARVGISDGQIDLGGVAKGFIADKMVFFLEKNGIERAIINLGGNVYTINSEGSRPWKIGVKSPLLNEGKYICVVETMTESVVTSGIYERFFEKDGEIYHHVLDPATGYPVKNNLLSVTVVGTSSASADAFSTALLCSGLTEGMKIARSQGLDAIFVTKQNKIYLPQGLSSRVTLSDSRFSVKYY
ncbi:MAG: FAD:protein FMN transferase [Spirochaetales bacterium]|nr:FAD:protein FMN transferase [Spirochaetales bacterium]